MASALPVPRKTSQSTNLPIELLSWPIARPRSFCITSQVAPQARTGGWVRPSAVEHTVRAASAIPAAAVAEAPSSSGRAAWEPGVVARIESPDELKDYLRTYQDTLVCLMCKARGCRPCKAFERKYAACAEDYRDVVFLDIYGDLTVETRKLMIALHVKSTPTFMLFRAKSPLHTHSGISESKLRNALNEFTGREEVVFSEPES